MYDVIRVYYIRHVVTTSISFVASLSFINPLLWPHGIVKYPSNAHFRISPEELGHLFYPVNQNI